VTFYFYIFFVYLKFI